MVRVRFRIQDVNPRRSDARYDQVTTLHMRVRVLRAEARAACVPAKVMQLVIVVGKINLTDELAISGGPRIDVDNAHGVAPPILTDVEQRDVGDAFRRGLHRHARRRIKAWIWRQGHIHILLWKRVTAKDSTRLGSTRCDALTRRYKQATTNDSKGNDRKVAVTTMTRIPLSGPSAESPRSRTWVILTINRPRITGLPLPSLCPVIPGSRKPAGIA